MATLAQDLQAIVKWAFVTPIFCIWPFVSFFPAFGFLMPPTTVWTVTANTLFLATSMLGLMGTGFLLSFIQAGVPTDRRVKIGQIGSARIAFFGLCWLSLYAIYAA